MKFQDKLLLIGSGRWGNKLKIFFKNEKITYKTDLDITIKELSSLDEIDPLTKFFKKIDFDTAWIATGNQQSNNKIIRSLISIKKNIIIEKPIELNSDFIQDIKNYCKNYKKYFFINYQYIYHPDLIKLKKNNKFNNNNFYFQGIFEVRNENNKIDDLFNLGSHLLSIYFYYFPKCKMKSIKTAYKSNNVRSVIIFNEKEKKIINLNENSSNLLKDFVKNIMVNKDCSIYTNVDLNNHINKQIYNLSLTNPSFN